MKKDTSTSHTTSESNFRPKILVVDDDPVVTRVIGQHLRVTFPDCEVNVSNKPEILPGYNVYFIDNDFDGQHMAKVLLEQARQLAPHSLVVALSSTLTMEDLQILVNLGCNAVYSKQSPHKSEDAKEVVRQYLTILKERQLSHGPNGFLELLRSIKGLLSQWNQRLGKQIISAEQQQAAKD